MKLVLRCLAVASVAVFLPAAASGGTTNTLPLKFGNGQGTHILTSMDTPEPPDGHFASNNTGCAWNDEDEIMRVGYGSLVAGQAVSDTVCLVADLDGNTTYPKLVIARVYVPKTSPTVSLSISNDAGDSWTATGPPASVDHNQVSYQLCIADAVADRANIFSWRNLDYWPLVPGTTGYGQIVHYTVHVAAPQTIKSASAYFSVAFNGFYGTSFRPQIQKLPGGEVPCPPSA